MTGWDGGFFGLPFTCECRIYGETEGRKNCSEFKKRVTKSDLLNKIQSLEKENEQLKKECKIAVDEMINDYKKLEKENEQLKKECKIAVDEMITDYKKLEKENEQLRKQIQNYKQLIANSYVGEEETLDGFTEKYVIWENELQTELDISKGGE